MEIKDKLIGKVVSENYRTADIFLKYGIDFCCGGGISIEEACTKNHIDQTLLVEDLLSVIDKKSDTPNYQSWSLSTLSGYIVDVHHAYVKENLPLIEYYAEKVADVHGESKPEVIRLLQLFRRLKTELYPHLQKEEEILFPILQELDKNTFQKTSPVNIGVILEVMHKEHDEAGDIIKEIGELTNNYTPPSDACQTFRILYYKLNEFASDLFKHIHLENNILFEKTLRVLNAVDNNH